MNELIGKTAIITGAGSGIGRAAAIKFAEEGASAVIVSDINPDTAEETSGIIRLKHDCKILIHNTDVSSPEDVESLFLLVDSETEGVDVLVNCAGICPVKKIENMSIQDWNRTMEVNLGSMFLTCRGALPVMRKRKAGSIVNIASISGRIGGIATGIDYATSKGAVEAFTKSLAKIGGPDQVRVNAVAPGFIDTNMTKDFTHFDANMVPLRRIGNPEDVADVILFLSSERSRYITGCTLDVSGGVYMG